MTTRFKLVRESGEIHLERWGWECRFFGVFVHKIDAPDPGLDLHNHPWTFWSFVIKGGYREVRTGVAEAHYFASHAKGNPDMYRGTIMERNRWSFKKFPLVEAHSIIKVKPGTWTLVFRGRKQPKWGFFTPDGFVESKDYDSRLVQ